MRIIGFGDMNFEDYGFWTGVEQHLPFASAIHNLIQRPGSTPVFGTPTIPERRIPVQIGWSGEGPYTTLNQAWEGLMRALRPTDTTPRELRARTDDNVLVAMLAVVEIPAGMVSDVNVVPVNFVTVDLEWVAISEVVQTATLSLADAQALLVDTGQISDDPGRIFVRPTTQRTSGGSDYGFKYKKTITLTNNYSEPLVREPVLIPLGSTTALVSGSKALASGNDFRIIVDGLEIPRTLKGWNTADTGVWVIIPNLAAGSSMVFDFLYGNPLAGAPVTLDYPNGTAFDPATSTNASWIYLTDDVAASAGKGLWYLSSGTTSPDIDTTIPGAWQISTTKPVGEDYTQLRAQEYTASGTKYRATFSAERSRAGAINPQDNRNGDAVVLHSSRGITSINFGYTYRNDREGVAGTYPVGIFVALARSGAQPWAGIHVNLAESHETVTTVAAATYTPTGTVTDVALAVWPYNQVAVRAGVVTGRKIDVEVNTNITVNLNTTGLAFGSLSAETEVYELAERIITFEDGTYRVSRMVLLGKEAGGRLYIPLGNTIIIDGLARTVEEWDSTATTLQRVIPPTAYAVYQEISPDVQEDSFLAAADVWPKPERITGVLTNSTFDSNITGWERRHTGTGMTSAAPAYSASVFNAAAGSLSTPITASTASITAFTEEMHTAKLSINGRYVVDVSAASRTTNVGLVPRLGIRFYTEAETLIEAVHEDVYIPSAADAWRRRVLVAEVPDGAVYWQPVLQTYTRVANSTGTVYWDDVYPSGGDLVLLHQDDDVPGTIALSYGSFPSYA